MNNVRSLKCTSALTVLGVMLFTLPLAPLTSPDAQAQSAAPVSPLVAEDKPVLLQADRATFDATNGLYTATGNVEASYGNRTLHADKLTYDVATNQVEAEGNVIIIDENEAVLNATKVTLDGALQTGLIETFGLLIGENARLAGAHAKRSEKATRITQAVYSPCKVCKDERNGEPVWQIKALKVTHDRQNNVISYQHAWLEVMGLPVLYMPRFWHPDPTTKRKSGFLVPRAGNSTDLGNFIETPYYWALAPHYDLTVAPMFLSEEASVFKSDFRMRTKTGEFELGGSVTNPNRRDADGNPVAGKQVRNHLFGKGRFAPNPSWAWGYDIQLSSDDTYLRRYDIYGGDELQNHAFLQTRSDRNYAIAESYYFIGLRTTDNQGQTPIVLPNVDFEYHLTDPVLGGHVSLTGNFLSLQRTRGADMERLSLSSNWARPWVSQSGHVFNMFGDLRADLYHNNDIPSDQISPPSDDEAITARALPTLGVEWRFPLARPMSKGFQIIEPIAQIVASPTGLNPDDIANEDSLSFEFDDTNLFKANKFPGLDRWEEGLRLNAGIKMALIGRGAGENSLTLGQTFRQNESQLFNPASGLNHKRSDYVGKLVLTPFSQFRLIHRFRADRQNFTFRRNEIDIEAGTDNYRLELGYLKLGAELSESGLDPREELSARTHLKMTSNWAFEAQGIRNLTSGEMIRASASFVYRDECTDFEITARRRFTEDRDIEPATSIFFRIRLKSLG